MTVLQNWTQRGQDQASTFEVSAEPHVHHVRPVWRRKLPSRGCRTEVLSLLRTLHRPPKETEEDRTMTIVKVQIPIFSNDPAAPVLIYDERRRHTVMQQQIDDNAKRLMGSDYKAFFEAEWDGETWKLGKRVRFQP